MTLDTMTTVITMILRVMGTREQGQSGPGGSEDRVLMASQ